MKGFSKFLKENLNIPNIISLMRIVIIIPFTIFILSEKYVEAAVMLLISGLSDAIDGSIARYFNKITQLGAMLDPIADKLTLVAVMFCIGIKFPIIMPLLIILVGKEVLMLIAGAILIKKHKKTPHSKWYGKLGTVFFYTSVCIIVSLKAIFNIENEILILTLMTITAALMLFAIIKYFIIFLELVKTEETEKNYRKKDYYL